MYVVSSYGYDFGNAKNHVAESKFFAINVLKRVFEMGKTTDEENHSEQRYVVRNRQ